MLNDVSEILKAIKSLKLFDASFRDFITEKRFGTGIFCPRCNSSKVHKNGGTQCYSDGFTQMFSKIGDSIIEF